MRTLEATGKSIDEAIFNGLRELQISIDEVEIDIIQQETKGVFGIGAKPAIVRLIEREPEQIVIPDYIANKDMPRERRDRGGRRDRDRRDGRERRESYDRAPALVHPAIDYSEEAAEGNAAADFLKGLLAAMGVEATVLANVSEDGIRLRIDSTSMGILIGHRGETLDAIQYLTSLCINRSRKETGYTRVTIDTEGYRDKREETLTRLARKLASQVKATGRARTLEPMNPYERRVLHATLQNNPYVTTYSEGEEPNRRVVIAPKKREER